MKSQYQDKAVKDLQEKLNCSKLMAERIHTARLLGQDKTLVMQGGGNVSFKSEEKDCFGNNRQILQVKASGHDLAALSPDGLSALWMDELEALADLSELDDDAMKKELLRRSMDPQGPVPSIEALVHAWIPAKFIDHSHADAILTLTAHSKGRDEAEGLYGADLIILDYHKAGFELALAVREIFQDEGQINKKGLLLLGHGLFTWGEDAKTAYEGMIDLVDQAQKRLEAKAPLKLESKTKVQQAQTRWLTLAGILRYQFKEASGKSFLASPIQDEETLALLDQANLADLYDNPPLTPDHLIRTKHRPMILKDLPWDDSQAIRHLLADAILAYSSEYRAYLERNQGKLTAESEIYDSLPRMILIPGLGAIAMGQDLNSLQIARDILAQALPAKSRIQALGYSYQGLKESELFAMEYRPLQQAKLKQKAAAPLEGKVALISGSAGAIGSGIANELLHQGALLAVTDLPGDRLDDFTNDLKKEYGDRVIGLPLDVTDQGSIEACIHEVLTRFGGLDCLVINQGLAHVSTLAEMDIERFQLLEKVNMEGTLLLLKAFSNFFKHQGIGGDVILVSTKNVFSPSASFGAYSATKAGAHQLARIAALELAGIDVRVNMVSPDGVFHDQGKVKSGLWELVGPDRMKARGLDEEGLEAYYRDRNLLKIKVSARDVGRAVVYFASRQSPTTGATIPVDGGLPDATPR